VPTGTRIPTALTNNLWDRKLDSGSRVSLICRRRRRAAASQADGNNAGEHLRRELRVRRAIPYENDLARPSNAALFAKLKWQSITHYEGELDSTN